MKKIEGVITALVTPFDSEMKIDFNSLEKLVKNQVARGVKGFVINGTTAESPTLEENEVKDIWQAAKSAAGNDCVFILGTGSNSTVKTIKDTQKAKDWNADAALVVVPYYNKPPQRGLFQHFKKVADEAQMPIILYNVPGRTALSMGVETVVELSHVQNIIGIKDATGNMDTAELISQQVKPDFIKLSGDDGTYADYLSQGGNGIISVASHIIPEVFIEITNLAKNKKIEEARKVQAEYKELVDSLYVESNPIPVKKALEIVGLISSATMRLPLIEASQGTVEKLKRLINEKGVKA
jgi:4-hydroxy-tetrahydrodipicolinate synthase